MKKKIYSKISIIIILIAISSLYFYVTRYHIYLTVKSPNGGRTAEITWKRVFPYIQGVDAFLFIKDSEKNNVLFTHILLKNRDAYADIEDEFTGLSWDGGKVILKAKGNHYKGPLIIKLND